MEMTSLTKKSVGFHVMGYKTVSLQGKSTVTIASSRRSGVFDNLVKLRMSGNIYIGHIVCSRPAARGR